MILNNIQLKVRPAAPPQTGGVCLDICVVFALFAGLCVAASSLMLVCCSSAQSKYPAKYSFGSHILNSPPGGDLGPTFRLFWSRGAGEARGFRATGGASGRMCA